MKKQLIRSILTFLIFSLPLAGFSQNYIGKNKAYVKKILEKHRKENDSLDIRIISTDSTLTCSVQAGKTYPASFTYSFDKKGKCYMEKVTAGCDSCYKKYLSELLAKDKFEWKKINENQYVSKYSARRLIELAGDSKDYSYTILKTEWSKNTYRMLAGE